MTPLPPPEIGPPRVPQPPSPPETSAPAGAPFGPDWPGWDRDDVEDFLNNLDAPPHDGAWNPEMAAQLRALLSSYDRLRAEPAELEALPAGLDPEQEIRARAAAIVGCPAMAGLPDSDNHRAAWLEETEFVAAWIRDGSRPDTAEEATR